MSYGGTLELKQLTKNGRKRMEHILIQPVWKIWKEFETFLENKQISKMRKKHLGDQIVINSNVYMFFNCDQSWIKSYLLCYFWRPFPIILVTKHNWKSSLGDQPPRFSSLVIQQWNEIECHAPSWQFRI